MLAIAPHYRREQGDGREDNGGTRTHDRTIYDQVAATPVEAGNRVPRHRRPPATQDDFRRASAAQPKVVAVPALVGAPSDAP